MSAAGQVRPGPGQIAEEHERLRALLGRVEGEKGLRGLLALLGELRAELAEHFAHEEAAGGLETVVAESAPHLAGQVDELFEEHRRCLEEVDRLRDKAAAILDGPAAEVRREVVALCETLHEHERQETELLSGALYDEIGGSG